MPLHPARVWKMLIMQISELEINVKISATSHLNSVYLDNHIRTHTHVLKPNFPFSIWMSRKDQLKAIMKQCPFHR